MIFMANVIFALLFALTFCTHNSFSMDKALDMSVEGGELSDDSDTTSSDNVNETIEEKIDTIVDILHNAIMANKKYQQYMRDDNIFYLESLTDCHAILKIVDHTCPSSYTLRSAINYGAFRKLRIKNILFDTAIACSIRHIHKQFTKVIPETLDLIDDHRQPRENSFNILSEPIRLYIMKNAKNECKITNYWLQDYAIPDHLRSNTTFIKGNAHYLYLCRQAVLNTGKESSLQYIYDAHQYKQLTEYEQKNIIPAEIAERRKPLTPHSQKALSPYIRY